MSVKKEGMPWFRMYASVILADTNFRALNEIQTGWYFKLMLETWFRAGFLPDDDETLRNLAGCRRRDSWEQHKHGVLFFFDKQENDGRPVLVNAGLRQQWLSANASYDKKATKKLLTGQKQAQPKKSVTFKAATLYSIADIAKHSGRSVEEIVSMQNSKILPSGTHINSSSLAVLGIKVQ